MLMYDSPGHVADSVEFDPSLHCLHTFGFQNIYH